MIKVPLASGKFYFKYDKPAPTGEMCNGFLGFRRPQPARKQLGGRSKTKFDKDSLKEGPINPVKSFLLVEGKKSERQIGTIGILYEVTDQSKVFRDGAARYATRLIGPNDRTDDAKKTPRNSPSGNLIVHVEKTDWPVIFCFQAIIFLYNNL